LTWRAFSSSGVAFPSLPVLTLHLNLSTVPQKSGAKKKPAREAAFRLGNCLYMSINPPYFGGFVGTNFYSQKTLGLTEDEQIKVNCFDWDKEFFATFKFETS
jgi:hypothetical protein